MLFDFFSKALQDFQLILAMKDQAKRHFIAGLQNLSGAVSLSVTNIVYVDRYPYNRHIWVSICIFMSQVQSILHNHLAVIKLCSRNRLCQLVQYHGYLFHQMGMEIIIIGYETRIYSYHPKTKRFSNILVFQD